MVGHRPTSDFHRRHDFLFRHLLTRYLSDHGIESRFVNGLRVTTPETVDALLKVFALLEHQGLCDPRPRLRTGPGLRLRDPPLGLSAEQNSVP